MNTVYNTTDDHISNHIDNERHVHIASYYESNVLPKSEFVRSKTMNINIEIDENNDNNV